MYKKSLVWNQDVEAICKSAKHLVSSNLLDQLSRAALSIPLNIAEGNGRWHKPDKRQFFWVARGSVFECIPILHILSRTGAINDSDSKKYRLTLEELAKMLSGLIRSVENTRETNVS